MLSMSALHGHDDDFLFEAEQTDGVEDRKRVEWRQILTREVPPTHHDDFLYEEQREKTKTQTA
jgi:hypothetical protein